MNQALQEVKGRAWVVGAVPLTLLRAITEVSEPNRFSQMYDDYCAAIRKLCFDCRITVVLPTLDELLDKSEPYEYLETVLYREFMSYDISIAETLVFAHKVGAAVFIDPDTITKAEREEFIDSWRTSAERAEYDFDNLAKVFERYLDSEIHGLDFLNEVAVKVLKIEGQSISIWSQLSDAISARPGIAGFSIDLKKLAGTKLR